MNKLMVPSCWCFDCLVGLMGGLTGGRAFAVSVWRHRETPDMYRYGRPEKCDRDINLCTYRLYDAIEKRNSLLKRILEATGIKR